MKALIFEGEGKYSVRTVDIPKITSDEQVLVKVEVGAICGTDVHILNTPAGHPATTGVVLGHEFSGLIEKTGAAVKNIYIGDRVVVDPNLFCGKCYYCRHGQFNMCLDNTCIGIFIDGGFAQYCVVPQKALYKVSVNTSAERAVHLDPAGCVLTSINKIKPVIGDTAVVLGAGSIGLYFIMMLKQMGIKKIIVSEISELKIKYAYKFGADVVVNPMKEGLNSLVLKHTVDGADFAIDTVGTLINEAICNTRKGGKILLFGMNKNATQTICQNTITRNDLTIIGNFASRFKFDDALRLLESDILPVDDMITHRIALEEFQEGIDALKKGEAIKVLVDPWS